MCTCLTVCTTQRPEGIGFTVAGVTRGYEQLMWVMEPESGSSTGIATALNH